MDKGKKTLIAAAMIVVLAVAMIFIAFLNRSRDMENKLNYEAALVRENEKKEAREKAAEEKEIRKADAEAAVEAAVENYLPGVVFYGDSLTMGEGGNGVSYPDIVRALIVKNVYDIPTKTVNVTGFDGIGGAMYQGYIPVVFVGTNSGWDGNISNLIRQQKRLIGESERYIVIGIPTGSQAERAELEAEMIREYGDKYINLRQYLSTNGMESIELTPSAEDELAMSEGRTPPGLMSGDGVNLNYYGYKLVGFLTYDRMTRLGYFDEVLQAVEAYEYEQNTI